MSRKLKDVEVLSDERAADRLLGLAADDAADGSFDDAAAEIDKIRVVAR
jgi:hypothetical protein